MATGMLTTGISGIRAAQMGLQVTQHNIANANTDGYSRQYILQSPGTPVASGVGYFGTGTAVDTVRRAYDQYLTQQSIAAQTKAAESDAMSAKLSQLDNLFGDISAGLTPAIQDFYKGVNQVAANPSLVSARQTMLSASELLVNRFNSLATRVGELYDSVNGEIANEVQQVNSLAEQIADINYQIIRASASTSQPPNDLLDMRERLVAELNTHIKVSTVEDSIGNFNVFIGNGQQLVVGTVVNKLSPMNSSSDPERVVVGLVDQSGGIQELQERLVDGGVLGGLLKFRSGSLDYAANNLGMVAAALTLTFNAQHALGQDLDGLNAQSATPGFQADYFQIGEPRVLGNSTSPPELAASFIKPPTIGLDGNFQSGLTGSDYGLRSDGTSIKLTRLADGKVWSDTTIAGLNEKIASEGFSLGGTGPTANVDYLIEPTRSIALNMKLNPAIAADTAKIAAAAPAISELGYNTGSLSVSQAVVATQLVEASNGAAWVGIQAQASFERLPVTFTNNGAGKFTFPQGSAQVYAIDSSGNKTPITNGEVPIASLKQISFDGILVDVPASSGTFQLKRAETFALPNVARTFTYQSASAPASFDFTFVAGDKIFAKYADGSITSVTSGSISKLNSNNAELVGIALNGISVDLSGQPQAGDSFRIGPNTGGVADSRNALKLAALQIQKTTEGGNATLQGSYASLVSKIGSATRQAKVNGEAQQALFEQNEAARSAVSGVNLDEEAANLIKYQQAYQASARALDITSKLFDTLLGIGG